MMQEDIKELLELTKENNKLLRKMRRSAMIGNIMRIFYWAIIFGGPVVIYFYYLQPYLGQLMEAYSGIQDGVGGVSNQVQGLGGLLEKIGIGR